MQRLACLLFLLPLTTLSAQLDHVLLTDDAYWLHEQYISVDSDGSTVYGNYYLIGDTLVDGVAYRKLYADFEPSGITAYQGALREETGRVFTVNDGQVDTLLDFNLVVGDTVHRQLCNDVEDRLCYYLVLQSVDTVTLLDDVPRRRLNFSEFNEFSFVGQDSATVSWIDGVGSTRGLLVDYSCAVLGDRSASPVCLERLRCHQRAGGVVYSLLAPDGTPECEQLIDNVQELPAGIDAVTVYPNPTSAIVTLALAGDARGQWSYRLYDASGRALGHTRIARQGRVSVNVADLPAGLYFLRLMANGGVVTRRIIVE